MGTSIAAAAANYRAGRAVSDRRSRTSRSVGAGPQFDPEQDHVGRPADPDLRRQSVRHHGSDGRAVEAVHGSSQGTKTSLKVLQNG